MQSIIRCASLELIISQVYVCSNLYVSETTGFRRSQNIARYIRTVYGSFHLFVVKLTNIDWIFASRKSPS